MPKIRFAKGRLKLKKGEYQRPNKTFEYKWTDKLGYRHSVYAKSLEELRTKEAAILKDTLDGIKYFKQNTTLDSYYEIWKKVKSGIRDTTLRTYDNIYKCRIKPEFGETKLKDLSYSKIIMFYKELVEKQGLSISSLTGVNAVLSMIIDIAIKDGIVRTNPCRGAMKELKRSNVNSSPDVKALTKVEQELLEEYLCRPGSFNRLYPLVTVMLYTGMRIGEICALRWDDINFAKAEIHVNHTLVVADRSKRDGSRYALNPPKTKTGKRSIPISPIVKEALLLEKKYQKEHVVNNGFAINGLSNFVFTDQYGKVINYLNLNHSLTVISQEIDKEIKNKGTIKGLKSFPHLHSHMLRHTFATRMREAGADIKATAEIMGHKEVDMTLNTYTDASQEFKMREISLLGQNNESAVV